MFSTGSGGGTQSNDPMDFCRGTGLHLQAPVGNLDLNHQEQVVRLLHCSLFLPFTKLPETLRATERKLGDNADQG